MGYQKINDLLPLDNGGLFTRMNALVSDTLPWENEAYASLFSGITNEELDLLYAINSGEKVLPEIIQTETTFNLLLKATTHKHLYEWNELAKTYLLQYNPIENYSMIEDTTSSGTIGESNTQTHNMNVSGTHGNTETRNLSDATNGSVLVEATDDNVHSISGSYKDTNIKNFKDTLTESGKETDKHIDNLHYTDTNTHEADKYVKTSENLVAAFDSSTTATSTSGNTTVTDGTSSIGASDNSGYERQSKTIDLENGGYSDTNSHTVDATKNYTQDEKTFTDRSTVTEHDESANENYSERTYTNYKEEDNGDKSSTQTISNTYTHTGTLTNNGTDSQATTGTIDDVKSGTHSDTIHHTRSGNIGVTTSQQMLISETEIIALRSDYFNKVFEDIDKEMTIPIWL